MKPCHKPLATALAATLQLATIAAVPLAWDVRPGQPAPVTFDRYHGETIEFSATFRGFGALPFAGDADIRLWFQTNGMGAAWWSAPATIRSNVLSATWSPELDPGTDRVSLFFGAPSNAYAAAVLRLRHSPGFAPGTMPDPESFHESDPVFSAWLAGYTPPGTSLSPTNHSHAQITDGTNIITAAREVYEVARDDTEWSYAVTPPGHTTVRWLDVEEAQSWSGEGAGWYVDSYGGPGSRISVDPDADRLEWHVCTKARDATHEDPMFEVHAIATRRVAGKLYPTGRLALTNDIPDTTAIQRDIADLRTESSLVYRLYSGSNVVFEITNYNSAARAPELRLMQLNESNEYITVWTEANGLARTLAAAREHVDNATNALQDVYAPRAWSRTTSGLGFAAPDGMTWVSTPHLVIAGGLENEKHVTSGGAIWMLESNGMAADFHASDNNAAYLDISSGDGTSIFRIEKTDSFLVGVRADNVSVENGSTLVCGVNVVSAEHPLVRVKAALPDASWSKEEDGTESGGVTTIPGLATIAWTGTTGNWTCRITNLTGGNSLFAYMEYVQEGGTKIINSAPLDVTHGILCTDGVHKCRPVYTDGTITWEVVP